MENSRFFCSGSDAIVRGALEAGCDFFAGYPITPATSILLDMIAALPARGGVALQAEDEIASIGMCISAAMCGRRAMTATSGPGMSLYSENIGLAVMAETPLVIVNVQRMGPATGGATTGAEGDVQFMRWGASGGYPIIALAPTCLAESYRLTMRAFDLAERFRTPVMLATSKDLVLNEETADALDMTPVPVRSRTLYTGDAPFVPYRVLGPRDIPEFSEIGGAHQVRFTTSIHDERGLITRDRGVIERKLRHLAAKIDADEVADVEVTGEGDRAIVAYGMAARAARAAAKRERVRLVVVRSLWPVPERALRQALEGARTIVVPELNAGQYVGEIERVSRQGQRVVSVTRIDGGLLTPEEVLRGLS